MPEHVIDVVGEDPQADADLRGGEADTWRFHHGVSEVLDQLAQLGVEGGHGVGGVRSTGSPNTRIGLILTAFLQA